MDDVSVKTKNNSGRAYSVRDFITRVVTILVVLLLLFFIIIYLLVFLPLRSELATSLYANFNQLSFIRYNSLQNSIARGFEGAQSLSSRTVIRLAIVEYEDGLMDLEELKLFTQPKYEDGTRALEYLSFAERYVENDLIARYVSPDYDIDSCSVSYSLERSDVPVSAFCLSDTHTYYVIISPIHHESRIVGYDKLVFQLTEQMETLCTNTATSSLIRYDTFNSQVAGAKIVKDYGASTILFKDGQYYHTVEMQDDVLFVTQESEELLLQPIYRISRQILLAVSAILIAFTFAVYYFVIRFAEKELRTLESSRRSLSKAISEANLDPLTSTGTRRVGEDILDEVFNDYLGGEASPAIILFDVDFLKHINDTYGHSVGDIVIREIAATISKNTRDGDLLFRWGGDEFVGVLSGLKRENSLSLASKLLKCVSSIRIDAGADTIQPTISIGISYFDKGDDSYNDAIKRADKAMYQSKIEGKNRANELLVQY